MRTLYDAIGKIIMGLTWISLLTGCTQEFPMNLFPNELTYMEYISGRVAKKAVFHKGDPAYDHLYNFLGKNKTGWSQDINTYAPKHYFKSDVLNINCGDQIVIVNYRASADQWAQLSKKIAGCEEVLARM